MKTMILKSAQFIGLSMTSKMIRRQTGRYSHTGIFVGPEEREYILTQIGEKRAYDINLDTVELMEQWPHGGFIESWMDYSRFSAHTKNTPYEIWGIEMPVTDWEYCMSHYIKSCEDKRAYDWAGIAHFEIKRIKQDPDKTFCSEEYITPVAEILKWNTVKPFNVHPTMSVNLTQVAGGKILHRGIC